jgi:putative membrane protein
MLALFDGLGAVSRGFGPGMRGGGLAFRAAACGFPLWGIVAAVVVAGLVAAVIVLSIRLGRRGRRPSESLEIARARYARGEISKKEFEDLKKDLA